VGASPRGWVVATAGLDDVERRQTEAQGSSPYPSLYRTPWSGARSLRGRQLCSYSVTSAFYGTRRFITVLTRALQRPLSSPRQIKSTTLHPTALTSTLMLSIHLYIRLPNGLFPSGFSANNLYAYHLIIIYATCPDHLILLGLPILYSTESNLKELHYYYYCYY
jgi:hypothetical protein